MSASGIAQPSIKLGKPSITVGTPEIRAAQRRMAQATILIPFAGTVAALVLASIYGIGVLEIALLSGMYVLTSVGVELGFHRCFAHRAFETTRAMKVVLAALGSMAAEGSVLYWAAGHRRHHAHSDTGDDPHSPHVRRLNTADEPMSVIRGLWHSHVSWMMTDNVTNCTLFGKDILRDPLLNRIHTWYVPLILSGLAVPALVGGVVTGTWMGALNGFLWGGLVRMFLRAPFDLEQCLVQSCLRHATLRHGRPQREQPLVRPSHLRGLMAEQPSHVPFVGLPGPGMVAG